MSSWAQVEKLLAGLPETDCYASYGGFPALRVNKKLVARLRGEMAADHDDVTGRAFGEVLMVGVADLGEKEALLVDDPVTYFTVPHYDGYPAVLVRLSKADDTELNELLMEAWVRCAPKRAVKAYVEQGGVLPGEA